MLAPPPGHPWELACAQRFLDWYNREIGTTYAIAGRAEEIFPELSDTRWEFVARQPDSDEWSAIEVKRLPLLVALDRESSDWHKLCREVDDQLRGRLRGVIEVHFPPTPNFSQRQRATLTRVLGEVILEHADSLAQDAEFRDIGPDIKELFADWPETKSSIREYKDWGEFRPHKLLLSKRSELGGEVRLSGGASSGGNLVSAHHAAMSQVFVAHKPVRANTQLKLAKSMRAESTILLLDADLASQPDLARMFLTEFPADKLADIDRIYLVGNEEVTEVYSNS